METIATDHPRACGANDAVRRRCYAASGSSPRMRGKQRRTGMTATRPRIIPAHAGQTISPVSGAHGMTDHPRACGANCGGVLDNIKGFGSSPRMRGKPKGDYANVIAGRIIPAHAGQTARHVRAAAAASDHPRACGANRSSIRRRSRVCGSSPRMRGKLFLALSPGKLHRIIPAHAGQTDSLTGFFGLMTDHPRACGANLEPVADVFLGVGSSPRMRGKLTIGLHLQADARIIPAHAGQTDGRYSIPLRCSDHPRACGANTALESLGDDLGGSSPRMRGKRRHGT